MPRELIATAPRSPILREYDDPVLAPAQIRIRTDFASPKHGTELVGYRNEPAAQRVYDRDLGALMPVEQPAAMFPMALGNMAVGTVTAIGAAVTRFEIGDRVFGHWPIRESHTVDQGLIDRVPDGLSDEAAVCLDPAVMAFPIRDAGIRLGDRVAVFGMGAIGLIAVQLARQSGAGQIIAVDPLPERRSLAILHGADIALDPRGDDNDVGLAIRRLTGTREARSDRPKRLDGDHIVGGYQERLTQFADLGVDVAVEVSGNVRALHDAIRSTRFGGTICVLSYYGQDSAGLHLGEEFHMNRLQLVSARAGSLPHRDAPGWTMFRLVETTLSWLVTGRLSVDGIVAPICSFEESVEAFRAIDEHPEQSIKLGIRFPPAGT